MAKNEIVVFDFDGVIVDTFKITYDIVRQCDTELTEDEYRGKFDGNIHEARFRNDEVELCLNKQDFWTDYTKGLLGCLPIAGMDVVIQELSSKYPLAIISSSNSSPIKSFLELHNLDQMFSEIMGEEVHRSKVEKFKILQQKYSPEKIAFVTDTPGDVREAKVVNVPTVAVDWGFCSKGALLASDPVEVVSSPKSLLNSLLGQLA